MTEAEMITTAIGEFVSTEIYEVARVEYKREEQTAFTVIMENGSRYAITIQEIS